MAALIPVEDAPVPAFRVVGRFYEVRARVPMSNSHCAPASRHTSDIRVTSPVPIREADERNVR